MAEDQQPATRQDLTELGNRLKAQIAEVETRLKIHIDQGLAALAARLERAETALLTGFHSYARREATRTLALENRLAEVELRLLDIERHIGLTGRA